MDLNTLFFMTFFVPKTCFFHVPRHFSFLKTPNLSFNCLVQRKGMCLYISWSMCTCSFLCLILELSSGIQVTLLNSYQGHGRGQTSGEGHTQVPVCKTHYCKCLSGQQHQPIFSHTLSTCSECSVRRQKV